MTPLAKLVYDAVRFSFVALEDGISYEREGERLDPESFFMNYSDATEDIEWETFAPRIAAEVERLQAFELGVEYSRTDRSF